MSDRTAIRIGGQGSSQDRVERWAVTTADARGPMDRVGRPAGTSPVRCGDDQDVTGQPRDSTGAPRAARRRAPSSPARPPRARRAVAALPGDETATGQQREGELDEIGDRGDRARGHDRPGGPLRRDRRRATPPGPPRPRPWSGRRRPRRSGGNRPSCRWAPRGSPMAGRAAASGIPGSPPPEPRSSSAVPPIPRSSGTADSESRTCAVAATTGSRIAVRLIEPVQARSRRTWPSMAARASGGSGSPSAASPSSSAR